MSAYSEKLKDPRWQKKRLEILNRDEWKCRVCLDSENTLHIHHRYYVRGVEPWDYPTEALVTLCEDCHEQETRDRPIAEAALLKELKRLGFSAWDITRFTAGLEEMRLLTMPEIVACSYMEAFRSIESQQYLIDKMFERIGTKNWADR